MRSTVTMRAGSALLAVLHLLHAARRSCSWADLLLPLFLLPLLQLLQLLLCRSVRGCASARRTCRPAIRRRLWLWNALHG